MGGWGGARHPFFPTTIGKKHDILKNFRLSGMKFNPYYNNLLRLTHNCALMTSIPCCNFKPVQLKTELAILTRPKISTHHAVIQLRPSNGVVPVAQHFATTPPILEDERIRAPLVPIYLLTLTILC
jgi:hypothetical protein